MHGIALLFAFALVRTVSGRGGELELELELLQPKSAHYVISSGEHTSIPVRYDMIHPEEGNERSFCLQLTDLIRGHTYSENCVDSSQHTLNINEIGAGEYQFIAYIKEINEHGLVVDHHSQKTVNFKISQLAETLPRLVLGEKSTENKPIFQTVSDPLSETASIAIPLRLYSTASSFSGTDLEVCAWLTESLTEKEIAAPFCFASTQSTISMSNLPEGNYIVHAGIRLAKTDRVDVASPESAIKRSGVAEASVVSYELKVLSLLSVYPTVQLLHPAEAESSLPLQYVADTNTGKTNVDLNVEVEGMEEAVSRVIPCIRLTSISAGFTTPLSCLSPGHTGFNIYNLAVGQYTATINLQPISTATATNALDAKPLQKEKLLQVVQQSGVVVKFEVHKMSEFVPSYDWQPLMPWHSIPSGLETRLPIGLTNSPRKEARIPEPWRLQTSLPRPPCSAYFLRMDVTRHTTINEIRNAAAMLCSVPVHCVLMYGDEIALDVATDTVESTSLFFKTQKISLSDHCSVDS